jgi:anti-sigma B factor antagonist
MQHESIEVDRPEPGVVLLSASGDLDAYTAPGLRTRLHEAIEGGEDGEDAELVVVDLAKATFIDSAGLGALVGAHRRIRERGGSLRIVRPPALVARAFELTGLDEVLDIRDDRRQALEGR